MNKRRVVILGGGVGAMTAAHVITSAPDWKERFASVDVYQMGWRLGGKGASGRDQSDHDRIYEHGIHLWMGFYENAFKVMREVYAELDRPEGAPLRTLDEALLPQNWVGVTQPINADTGDWARWWIDMPVGHGQPGDGTGVVPLPLGFVERGLGILKMCALYLLDPEQNPLPIHVELARDPGRPAPRVEGRLAQLVHTTLSEALAVVQGFTATPSHDSDHRPLLALLQRIRNALEAGLDGLLADHPTLLMVWQVFDFGLALMRGIIADRVLTQGFDVLDGWDWLQWLKHQGLTHWSDNSPLLRAGYDLVFAYPDGRDRPPQFAAGAMARSLLRIAFSYKGSVMYHLAAGMGDVVFAPFYEVLKARGVRFFFFHKTLDLEPTADGCAVQRIVLAQQVELNTGDPASYAPLYAVKGLPSWPSEPFWKQVKGGSKLAAAGVDLESGWDHTEVRQVTLEMAKDFDMVVLGIPVGALKTIGKKLGAANVAFAQMLAKAQTVEVLACQLWLKPTLKDLGFAAPSMVMTGEAPVTDTYADMTEVLQRESWGSGPEDPHSLAYFCGAVSGPKEPPLHDPTYPKKRLAEGWRQTFSLLRNRTGRLWPKATSAAYPNGTDPSYLVAPEGVQGEDRWRRQYVRVNIDPGERFTLTPPGCLSSRLWPQLSGFANLALAGDWTRNPINAACVEGAAMSGILAARKVTGINYPVAGDSDFPGSGAPGVPATTGTMPAVVEQIGITSGPGPLELNDVKALIAVIPADRAALTKWCNDNFTDPSGGKVQVRPLVDAVLMQWAIIGQIRSMDPVLGPQLGWFPETDVGFWIPLGKGQQIGEEFFVEELVLAPAILFVNQPTGHTSGREVWGFPKQRGLFVNPKGEDDPGPFEAKVHTVAAPGGPTEFHPLLRVTATSSAPATLLGDATSALEHLLQMLFGARNANLLPGLKLPSDLAQLFRDGTLPMLFLKQIRDCEDVYRACYQAVTQCGASATYQRGAILGHYEIEVVPYYSHPIAETLGLQAKSQTMAAVWLEFNAIFENARVLASATP